MQSTIDELSSENHRLKMELRGHITKNEDQMQFFNNQIAVIMEALL